ncbi:helix-turn-helix domain-containing protein [Candidatus Daviesbacteria bacterium]|nr:helix-turn-helix domain-containing protein [Candidatus Daviesbacteria bacterium]
MDEFYTVNQAAAALKVHRLTIRRYIKEGNLKAFRAGGNIRIALPDLKAFTQSFVPKNKSHKELPVLAEANFSFNDPIFRLKARLGMNRPSEKG